MRGHAEMDRQLDAAEREGRCLHPTSESVRKALLRRVKTGDIVSPRPGLFIRSALWRSLDAIDQVKHVVRGLAHWHPDWVFGGVAAACMHDLWVDFSTARKALHARMLVVCATRGTYRNSRHIERKHHIHMNYVVIDGVRVTTLAQTAADCCAIMTFLDGKPIADSVMRKGVRAETIMECAAVNGMVNTNLRKTLKYANPYAENGGESRMGAAFIECGFMLPQQQVEFVDPLTGRRFRVDYLWQTADGRLIVVELDGLVKYTDPEMMHGRTVGGIVDDERERSEALVRAGVHTVIRVRMSDLADRAQLTRRLAQAGVPMMETAA